jgi:hypothetical protein
MNRISWKLQQISERLWILAAILAQQAVVAGHEGRGFAVLAEETRIMTKRVNHVVERELFDGEAINKKMILELAFQLNLLALNSAIEACRMEAKGRQTAVIAEEIRLLAYDIMLLIDEKPEQGRGNAGQSWPKKPLTTVNRNYDFLTFSIGGIPIKENLLNIREVLSCHAVDRDKNGFITLWNKTEYPVVNPAKKMGKTIEQPIYVILRTTWAAQAKTYAIAADGVEGIISTPLGTPVAPPADMPLAGYVRECWENENGEPFYFMDWAGMV